MIEQLPLFYDKVKKTYYYVGPCKCSKCGKIINDVVIIKHEWSKKHFDCSKYCLNCFNKIKGSLGIVTETRTAQIIPKRLKGTFHVLIQPPNLSDSRNNETIFSIADRNIEGEVVNDLTKLAGRESMKGCQIGLDPEELPKDKLITSEAELDGALQVIMDSKPIIEERVEYDKRKEVGYDDNKGTE